MTLLPPPVQQVRLAIYFPPLAVDAIDLDGIRSVWAAYAKVTQFPPMETDEVRLEADNEDAEGLAPVWPMALTVFESGTLGESILYQGDRFAVSWRSELTESTYPGYEALSDVLVRRYEEFRQVMTKNGVTAVDEPTRVEALYVNSVTGRTCEDITVHMLLGAGAQPATSEPHFDQFRRHEHWGDNEGSWLVITDTDDGADVSIRTTASSGVSLGTWHEALCRCHEQARAVFDLVLGGE